MNLPAVQSLPRNMAPEQVLELIEACRQGMQYVESVQDARMLVLRADAIRFCAQKSRMSREVQNQAAEVALRAQREAGRVTGLLETAPGTRTDRTSCHDVERLPKAQVLEAAGISTTEASRWERLDRIPDDQFEAWVAGVQTAGRELTTAGALALARDVTRPAEQPERMCHDCGKRLWVAS